MCSPKNTKTATKRQKTDRMEVWMDKKYGFLYEDFRFYIEIGPKWSKVIKTARNFPKNLKKLWKKSYILYIYILNYKKVA